MSVFNRLKSHIVGEKVTYSNTVPQYESPAQAIQAHFMADPQYERDGVWPMHLTSVLDLCERRQYLMAKAMEQGRVFPKKTTLADRVVWRIGKSTEQLMRDALIASVGKHNAFGKWSCICPKDQNPTVIYGLGRNPQNIVCPMCKQSPLSIYNEAKLIHDDLMSGNPDALIKWGPAAKLHVFEFKSMNGAEFKVLSRPDIKHIQQAYGYTRLMQQEIERFQLQGIEIETEKFYVHYTNKNYQFFNTHKDTVQKDYLVNVNSDISVAVRELYDYNLTRLRRLKTNWFLPQRTECRTSNCDKAKSCPVLMECFSE